jgi:SNF family Na+-dependent transporter
MANAAKFSNTTLLVQISIASMTWIGVSQRTFTGKDLSDPPLFAVVGHLRRWPSAGERLGAFVVGFYTLPEVVLQMPGSNFWAILLFFTLIVLGFSSAFVMLAVKAVTITGREYRIPESMSSVATTSSMTNADEKPSTMRTLVCDTRAP